MGLFSSGSEWDFYTFLKEVEKFNQTGYPPSYNKWPTKISLTPEVWEHVLKIRGYTTEENRERSITFFWADGDVVTTEYVRGQETFVSSKHSAGLKYEPTSRPTYFEKQITVDGKLVKKYTVDYNKIPKQPKVISLFNVHTHPKREGEKEFYYNFLSDTDVNSLIGSSSLSTGLIIDKFWLVCKTGETNFNSEAQQLLQNLAGNFTIREPGLMTELQEFCQKSGIVLYRAKYKGRLVKI